MLVPASAIAGVADWDHMGLGSRAIDLISHVSTGTVSGSVATAYRQWLAKANVPA